MNVFDYVLDESQCRALEEALALAARTGLALEVVDLTRQGLLARLLGFGSGGIRLRPLRTAIAPLGLRETKTEPQREGEVMQVACQT